MDRAAAPLHDRGAGEVRKARRPRVQGSGHRLTVEIVFETHSITEDNQLGIATGWLPGRLSSHGRELARSMGDRRRNDGLDAVFTSDLHRAIETVTIAFEGSSVPVFHDWRLRECNYGSLNGGPAADMHRARRRHLDHPYPDGESWRDAVRRAGRVLDDLRAAMDGRRVLVVGHVATRWACDHYVNGVPIEQLVAEDFEWREGWEYRLG